MFNRTVRIEVVINAFRTVSKNNQHFVFVGNIRFIRDTKERTELYFFQHFVGFVHQIVKRREVSFADRDNLSKRFVFVVNVTVVIKIGYWFKRIINVFCTISKNDQHFIVFCNIAFGGNADKRTKLYRFKHFVRFVHQAAERGKFFTAVLVLNRTVGIEVVINAFRTVSKHNEHFIVCGNIRFIRNADECAELYRFKYGVGFVHQLSDSNEFFTAVFVFNRTVSVEVVIYVLRTVCKRNEHFIAIVDMAFVRNTDERAKFNIFQNVARFRDKLAEGKERRTGFYCLNLSERFVVFIDIAVLIKIGYGFIFIIHAVFTIRKRSHGGVLIHVAFRFNAKERTELNGVQRVVGVAN